MSATREVLVHGAPPRVVDDLRTPERIRWIKLAELLFDHELACVDGRAEDAVIGAPGGSTGELVLVLAASERLLGRPLGDEELRVLVRGYVEAFGRFYQHTDTQVLEGLDGLLGREDPWAVLLQPPEPLRAALLDALVRPEHVGCGHLRSMLLDPDAYGTRREVVQAVIRGFFELLWDGHPDVHYVLLDGQHGEQAVVQVHICGGVHPFTRVPLVAPSREGAQAFVSHPEVLAWMRRQHARWLAAEAGLAEDALLDEVQRLGARQLQATLDRLAAGLPVYDATFCGEQVEVVPR